MDGKEKLLIVDDLEINRMVLRTLFDKEFHVLEAKNGIEAVAVIEQYSKQLCAVILDIVMPEMDGFAVLEQMKKNGTINDVPVIMITVYAETENEINALTSGATEILLKPIEPVVVKKRVWNVINLFRYRKHLEVTIDSQKRMMDLIKGSLAGGTVVTLQDERYTIVSINDELLARLGYENREEFDSELHGEFIGLIHPDDIVYVHDYIESSIKRGKRYEITYRARKKSGKYVWFIENGQPIETDDGNKAIHCVCVDIDRQIELQRELIDKENALNSKRLELISFEEMAPGGVFHATVDDNITITRANANFYKYMDFVQAYDSMNKTHVTMRDLVAPKDFKRYLAKVRSALEKCESSFSAELCVITKSGRKKWVITNGRFIMNNGKPEIYSIIIDHTNEHEAEEYLHLSEERFRIALSKTKNVIIDYDVRCGIFELSERADELYGIPRVIRGTPEVFIEKGLILDLDADDFLTMCNSLSGGAPSASCTVRTMHKTMLPHWSKITFNAIRDSDGELVRAIGFIEDISEINMFGKPSNDIPKTAEVIESYSVNLTKNRIWSAKSDDNENIKSDVGVTYSDMVDYIAKGASKAEEQAEILKNLNITAVTANAESGDFNYSYEYHRSSADGKIAWARLSANCIKSENGDVFVILYVRDIDSRKKKELALPERAEHDELTGLYTSSTVSSIISAVLSNTQPSQTESAVFAADIINYAGLYDSFGKKFTDGLIVQTAKLLSDEFGQKNIIGRMFENRFIGMINGKTTEEIIDKTESVCKCISGQTFTDDYAQCSIKVVFGLSFVKPNNREFEKLYAQAETAQKNALSCGEQYSVYTPETHSFVGGASTNDSSALLVRCISAVCAAQTSGELFNRLLNELGAFFGADRCFVLEFGKDGSAEISYEWVADGCESHIKEMKDVQIYSVQRWVNSCKEGKPFYVSDCEKIRNENPIEYSFYNSIGVHSVYGMPYVAPDKTGCLLCLDNPLKNLNSFGLFESIAQHVAHRLVSHVSIAESLCSSEIDGLTGTYTRSVVPKRLKEFSVETLSSVGIIVLDINGTKRINDELGQTFGDEAIRKTAMILRKFFGSDVYRISGDEFMVICTDITRSYFVERVETLRDELSSVGPYGVSTGSAWADVDINITNLRKSADEMLMVDKNNFYARSGFSDNHKSVNVLTGLVSAIHEGMFRIYLQPKADMKTKKIIGAEALSRVIHPIHGVVPPIKFIPLLEKEHVISYLDLFVFEEVCKLLQKWKSEDRELITVSLNFSRVTLLEPDIVEKMEKIHAKYDVPRELLEIEITESVGEMEQESIAQISADIIGKGYRISLDDFGSKYTNISIISLMKFHVLKLDKSLVNNLVTNESSKTIVEYIIRMCHELDVEVIAEGVETEEQFAVLNSKKCDMAQGYLFNKPISAEDFKDKYL